MSCVSSYPDGRSGSALSAAAAAVVRCLVLVN